ncbi:capsular polysaccharide biosynthesis protein [Pontiella sp.]|uniref:capsular polysaccharide biosynthesis protein n=1 Tax=Pontiella sp. TaxID=2837462 RepID=UPI003569DAA7
MKTPPTPLYPASAYVGWGRKKSGSRAVETALKDGARFELFEDGFLRSVEREDEALSMVRDDLGIYYDASSSCCLEMLAVQELGSAETERVRALVADWRALRLSKYNAAPEFEAALPKSYVLVVDQVAGDLSIEYGLADAGSFGKMLSAALDENPEATVIVKMHPDIYTREKSGHYDVRALEAMDRVVVIAENAHPVGLIEHAEAVYAVTSQMGFEALLWGKRVRCFGMPFYAGWGLTEDELPAPERRGAATLEQLVHAALVEYPRYRDPETGAPCAVERVMEHIGLQRRCRSRFPQTVFALGFSRWKKPILRSFFAGSAVRFVKGFGEVPQGATIVVWGIRPVPEARADLSVLRVEDGFLRSSGLGADLIRPLSWVVDDEGIYYDATRPSRLETLLINGDFDEAVLERARALRATIVSEGLSKYNLGATEWRRPDGERQVVLVAGQVENDASIRRGAVGVATNLDLLKAVRAMRPDAYVVYKPHPDVVAGLRKRGANEEAAADWCNEIVASGDVARMLCQVDELHAMTSLAGFEALLRGVPVVCHGQPFYAGWGLTTDVAPPERRGCARSLDELVAAALILYPTYVSLETNAFTTPERAVRELVEWRGRGPSGMPPLRRVVRWMGRFWAASGFKRNA